ncbi:hypothetical protein TRVA0_003S01508 [Trichomonascus vanleenenianus]|uniref:autophagy-related protein 101 n=1 Tax=Trichomonascus vanleenenianus TaxID=2268995 RepID=UPI003EC9E03B
MDIKYEITAEKSTVRDVVKCLLSTILFYRLFGPAIPQTREVCGVTYPSIASATVDALIEEKISLLLTAINQGGGSFGQIGVQFFEKRNKPQRQSWFAGPPRSEEVCWEQWVIDVNVVEPASEKEREVVRAATSKRLREILLAMVSTVNQKKSHIPPITTTDAVPFPYTIVVPNTQEAKSSSSSNETWGDVFKKLLE